MHIQWQCRHLSYGNSGMHRRERRGDPLFPLVYPRPVGVQPQGGDSKFPVRSSSVVRGSL